MEILREPSKSAVQGAAYQLGRMLPTAGDFYDVVENLAAGYAAQEAIDHTLNSRTPKAQELYWQLVALSELASVTGHVLESIARDGRDAGMTWQQIGDALDITRQAAAKRFAPE